MQVADVLITKGEIEEDTDPTFFRLMVNADGVALTTADILTNGVTMKAFDVGSNTSDTPIYTASSLNPTTSYDGVQLFTDTLRTAGWTQNSDGYNFRYKPSATSIGVQGGHTYRFEFSFALTGTTNGVGTGTAWAIYEVAVRSVWTS